MWTDFPCKLVKGGTRPKKNIGGRKTVWMARWILEQKLGRPIESGKIACHRCDNKLCIEPEHIYEGTYRSNALDAGCGGWHGNQYMIPDKKRSKRKRLVG